MGSARGWIIRGLLLLVFGCVAVAGWTLHTWVSPERVREAVLAAIREQFPHCTVQISSARLRLFGGICVTDWTLTQPGETEPFFSASSAVIAHDKEQLNHGRVVIRKIELDGPVLHVRRHADGSLNLDQLFKEGPADQAIPTVTIRNAVIQWNDDSPNGLPPLTILASKLNFLNDPISLLKIDVQAVVSPRTGEKSNFQVPFTALVKRNRATQQTQIRLEVPTLPVTPEVAPALARLAPQVGDHFAQLTAQLSLKADLTLQPGQPLRYEIKMDLKEGRLDDPDLPLPVEFLSAVVQIKDGRVIVEKGMCKLGRANTEFSLETRDPHALTPSRTPGVLPDSEVLPPQAEPLQQLEEKLERFELHLRDLALDDEFFARLPGPAKPVADQVRRMFNPTGSIDVSTKFSRGPHGWRREIEVLPNRLSISYEHFRYPIVDLGGYVKKVMASDGTDEYRLQLTGSASGRRVELSGRIQGTGPDPLIDLKIAGSDVPIDQKLFNALPPKHTKVLHQLRATARGDFIVEIKQPLGVNRCENTFRVRIYDGQLNYEQFPYQLNHVKGRLLVRVASSDPTRPVKPGLPITADTDTDRIEIRDCEAVHNQSKLWLSGDYEAVPGTRDHIFRLRVQGEQLPLDDDLRQALVTIKAGDLWQKLQPQGTLTFGADIELIDRDTAVSPLTPVPASTASNILPAAASLPGEPDFNPVTDLKLALNFKGPTITPQFFPYELQEIAGVLRYAGGKVDLARFSAKHGNSRLSVEAGEVIFGDGGEVWSNLGGIRLKPFIVDPVLLEALPPKLRASVSAVKLKGSLELSVKHLVIKVPALPPQVAVRGQSPLLAPPVGRSLPPPTPPALPDPVVYWDAELKLAGASCSLGVDLTDAQGLITTSGRYEGHYLGSVLGNVWLDRVTLNNKVPLTSVKVNYRVRPQQPDPAQPGVMTPPVLECPSISGLLFSGTFGGEARVEFREQPRYRVMLTAANVRLEDLAAHLKLGQQSELRGLAQGRLYLENQPDPRTGQLLATGAGQIDVPSGRMLNLPVLLPLLKLLKLQAPDQTAFEEAHALFELQGERILITQLDLIGNAVSLGGWGELDLPTDELRLEFYTIWSQALKRWLTTPLGDMTSFLSGNLFKIEMIRKNGEMTYKPVMLPAITEPVRGVAERLRNRFQR